MMQLRDITLVPVCFFLIQCQPRPSESSAPPPSSARELETAVGRFCTLGPEATCEPPEGLRWTLEERTRQLKMYVERFPGPTPGLSEALARYEQALKAAEARPQSQAPWIEKLLAEGCRWRVYTASEQMTFARELSREGCDPLQVTRPAEVAEALRALARVSLPNEREELERHAERMARVAPLVQALKTLRQEIFERRILTFDADGRLRVARLGHPYEHTNPVKSRAETEWLKAYRSAAAKLSLALRQLDQAEASACPEPACEAEVYNLADAVTLAPPLDWAFRRDGNQIVPPSPYALSYFSQRYAGDGVILRALGLDRRPVWLGQPDGYNAYLRGPQLVYADLLKPWAVRLVVEDWTSRTAYPFVVPLFLMFQEARELLERIQRAAPRADFERIAEIRFRRYDPSQDLVTRVPIKADQDALNINVFDLPGSDSIEQVRGQVQAAAQKLFAPNRSF